MSNQRRLFLRNVSLGTLGSSFFINSTFSKPLDLNSTSLNLNYNLFENSVFDKVRNKGFNILFHNNFNFNNHCKAIPLTKDHLLFGTENKLLILSKNNYFILSEKQQTVYNEFVRNYNYHLSEIENRDLKSLDFVTPVEILATNTNGDFRFKNAIGTTIEVHASKKKQYIKIL